MSVETIKKYGHTVPINRYSSPKIPLIRNGKVTYRMSVGRDFLSGNIGDVMDTLRKFSDDGWQRITDFEEEVHYADTTVTAYLEADLPATEDQLKVFSDWEEEQKMGRREHELKQLKALQQKYGNGETK